MNSPKRTERTPKVGNWNSFWDNYDKVFGKPVARDYPSWICFDCGKKHGRRTPGVATYHENTCDICGEKKLVTEPRDFGHLPEWEKL